MTDAAVTTPHAEEDKVLPAVVYALHLLGFASGGLTSVAGLIVAYVNRDGAGPINESHYTFAIRSFWQAIAWFLIGGAVFLVGLVLSVVLIGIPLLGVGVAIMCSVSVWFVVRCVLGIYYLSRGEAYPRPRTWLI